MNKILLVFGLAIAVVSPLAAAGPAQAVPGPVASCDDVVRSDTTAYLTSDLHCALQVEDRATVDLNGFTLDGAGATSGLALQYRPVANQLPWREVTVRNGTIRGWDGVWNVGRRGPGLNLKNVTVSGVKMVYLGTYVSLTASESTFIGNGNVLRGDLVAARFTTSKFIRNDVVITGSRAGVLTVTDSSFVENRIGIECIFSALKVERSTFVRNTEAIAAKGCYGASIRDSTFERNTTALSTVLRRYDCGCYPDSEAQARLDSVVRNSFSRNGTAVRALHSGTFNSNRFDRNGSAFESLSTAPAVPPILIVTDNSFTRNVDGVNVSTAVSLGGNVATRNTRYGIFAPLAIDLGGNVASSNGAQPQCVGVKCG